MAADGCGLRRRRPFRAAAIKAGAAFGCLSLALAAAPAAAQDAPDGIGFAQAEEGTWWCRATDAPAALQCAMQKCTAESGGQECLATRWCYPAGWSALMIVWLPEFHSTHVICGMPGRPAALSALKSICNAAPEFTRCDLVLTIDPDGVEQELSETVVPAAGYDGSE
jgi:hypothetical protein